MDLIAMDLMKSMRAPRTGTLVALLVLALALAVVVVGLVRRTTPRADSGSLGSIEQESRSYSMAAWARGSATVSAPPHGSVATSRMSW
jgi:hypothetical protein